MASDLVLARFVDDDDFALPPELLDVEPYADPPPDEIDLPDLNLVYGGISPDDLLAGASASGLSLAHRLIARDRTVAAAVLGLHHAPQIGYTQGPHRWDGIHLHKNARLGQYAAWYDCSAFVTWCLWNGLDLSSLVSHDIVNGANWTGGFTGTGIVHGKLVKHLASVQRADTVFYGAPGSNGEHEAIVVGRRPSDHKPMVVSHGSPAGPLYLPYDYRGDVMCFHRYI